MLDGHVLILNRSWMAVNVASVKRAMNLLYIGAARAVHPEDFSLYDFDDWCMLSHSLNGGRYVQTPTFRVRIPDVLLLHVFNDFVRREVRFSRMSIFERDQFTCQYCSKRLPKSQLTIDHVLPVSRGGGDSWENLVLACFHCNVRKGDRTPEEAHMPLLRHPAKPSWIPHFGARIPPDQLVVWRKFVDPRHWKLTPQE